MHDGVPPADRARRTTQTGPCDDPTWRDIIDGVPDLIVVTGPPGAGKTTVARILSLLFEPSALVAGDDFFAFIGRGYLGVRGSRLTNPRARLKARA